MEKVQDSLKYKLWHEAMTRNQVRINHIEELHTIRKPKNGEILFTLIKMEAYDSEGIPLLPIVLLRGHFVTVLTCITNSKTGEKLLLLVKQRRVANGAIFYEHPAGMCDNDADPFKVAVKEVEEETGVTIHKEQLTLLKGELYSSPGLIDEAGYFFACELTMTPEQIADLQNRKTGAANEAEFIEVVVVTFEEAFKLIKNVSGLLNIYLYLDKGDKHH